MAHVSPPHHSHESANGQGVLPSEAPVHPFHHASAAHPAHNHTGDTPFAESDGDLPPLCDADDMAPHSRPRSPLYPSTVILAKDRSVFHHSATETGPRASHEPVADGDRVDEARHRGESLNTTPEELDDPARGALLIYPKKINNLRRFRMLFVGFLVSISSSTQVLHSMFGVIYFQSVYLFNVHEMTIIYLAGTAMGMFTFPYAVLYDWFGPRVPIAVASAVGALGHLLFALTFAGHIPHTIVNCAVFYAIMCWGCYGLDVVVVPTVLTHMPRDRGVPVGLLQAFSTFGGNIFTCWFRGFFEGSYEHLMWLMFSVMVAAGVAGTWYLEDAPYVVNRWRRRRITPRQQLRAFLLRNRYMSQLVPQRRVAFMTMIFILMNIYLFIQGVCVGYLASDITPGKMRGIAIGSIVLVLLILILVVPVNAIDGLSEQDKEVIAAAKEKEAALRAMQAERYRAADQGRVLNGEEEVQGGTASAEVAESPTLNPQSGTAGSHLLSLTSSKSRADGNVPDAPSADPLGADGERSKPPGGLSAALGLPLHSRAMTIRSLMMVDVDDADLNVAIDTVTGDEANGAAGPYSGAMERTFTCVEHAQEPQPEESAEAGARAETGAAQPEPTFMARMEGAAEYASPDRNPRVETINLCGEVYVAPVYSTTFLQSLMSIDMWLIFYTTMCMWGVGLTMLGSWNIEIMVNARYGAMETKHYILVSGFCGMTTAIGRVFLGIYERLLKVVRERTGVAIVPTLIYPFASLGLFLGMILWIALPGNLSLLAAYIVSAYFYGMNTSATFYVISTIYARDIGMHYGFCYLGAGIGFVLCYWCSWYLTYAKEETSGYCIGERRCMNRAVGIYLCLIFSSIFSAFQVHRRYFMLVNKDVLLSDFVADRMRGLWRCCCGCCLRRRSAAEDTDSSEEAD